MENLKIAVIGAGFIGRQHVEAIRRIQGTEVAVLVESDPQAATECSRQMGIPRYCTRYEDLLADSSIDVIHNCTPNSQHFAINRAFLEAGKAVYSEKPLGISSDESGILADLAARRQVPNAVNFNYRHNPIVQEMRQRVQSGDAGRVLTVHGHYLQDWLLYETDYNWRMDPAVGGRSRAVADIGSHWFDLAQYITGQKIRSVCAHFKTVHPMRKRGLAIPGTFAKTACASDEQVNITTEDAAFILLRLADGTPGSLLVSQVCAGRKNDLQITVSASECTLDWAQENPDKLHVGRRGRPNELVYAAPDALDQSVRRYATLPGGHPVGWADALRSGITEFYTALRSGSWSDPAQSFATFQDGHAIMKLVDACLTSNDEGRWVDVE